MNPSSGQKDSSPVSCVVHVSREYGDMAGAGGIKDVTEGLCNASASEGIDTHVFLPFYQVIDVKDLDLKQGVSFDVAMNYPREKRTEPVTVHDVQVKPGLMIHLIKSYRYDYLCEGKEKIKRQGIYQYTSEEAKALQLPELEGRGYIDFFAMNVLLVKSALHALSKMDIKPDIIHCHDGHAALLPLLAQASEDGFDPFLRHVPSIVTVHNAGKGYHQEITDLEFAAAILNVPREVIDGCLLNGSFDPLLAGGIYGSAINTVSENYARELQNTGQDSMTGWLGHKLAGLGIRLLGVTNGIYPQAFDPEHPEKLGLASAFSVIKGDFKGKEACKKTALEELGKKEPEGSVTFYGTLDYKKNVPLLTFIGRLVGQKGYDILAEAVELLFSEDKNVQLLGLGDGDLLLIKRFIELEKKFHKRICLAKGYSQKLAHKIYAAGDFFIIPSRFEPCGLTDFFAQLMGNIPIVHRVGGLVKTIDGRFGFSYLGGAKELFEAMKRGLKVYNNPDKSALRKIQVSAVKNIHENFTWEKVLEKKYLPLYLDAIGQTKPVLPYE
jgi:starch synthase